MGNSSSKLIKYINFYLQLAKYLLPVGIILGFISMISSLLTKGMYNHSRFSVLGIKLIVTPKRVIFSPLMDGILITIIGIIIASLFILVILKLSKFINNIKENSFLEEENGQLLKQSGLLISAFSIVIVMQEIMLNYGIMMERFFTWYSRILMLIIMPALYILVHPIFL